MSTKTRTRQRFMLVAVFALFFLPVLTAYVLRLNPSLIGEFTTSNRGELIQPPREVEPGLLRVVGTDNTVNDLSFDAHWTVLFFVDGSCTAACRDTLAALDNVRIAMHKDRDRLRRVVVVGTDSALPDVPGRGDDLLIVRADVARLAELLGIESPLRNAGIHLIDPRGFLFMRYAPGQDPSDLLKDLKRLLRISKVG